MDGVPMTPDEIARTTDTQTLWQALRAADAEGDDTAARLLRDRLAEVTAGQERPGDHRPAGDSTVLAGTPYQDNQVTWAQAVGILGVIVLLGAVAWIVIPSDGSRVITQQEIGEVRGEWPFTVEEVTVTCEEDTPIYELSGAPGTVTFSDDDLADSIFSVPPAFRAPDAQNHPDHLGHVRRAARDFCR